MDSVSIAKKLRNATFTGEKLASNFDATGHKEFVVVGRSNCGKSTFLAKLFDNNKLVKTSKLPGHTVQINHFHFGDEFYMVDTPGYGYAKVAKSTAKAVGKQLVSYLQYRRELMGMFHIWDIRRDFGENDALLWNLTERLEHRAIIVTKCDKLAKNHLNQRLKQLNAMVKSHGMTDFPVLLPFSALNKSGLSEIHRQLGDWIEILNQ